MNKKDKQERRGHKRYEAKGESIAAFRSKEGDVLVGYIKDISKKGLKFEYTDLKRKEVNIEGTIDIYVKNFNYYTTNIPCKIVRSTKDIQHCSVFGLLTPVICCGVEFKKLSEDMQDALEDLIKKLSKL